MYPWRGYAWRMKMYYPDELIEEVRMKNDIVDVISGYVKIQKKGAAILACVLSTTRSPRLFPSPGVSRCITVSAAERGECFYIHHGI